jgi:hypothetical protein
MLGKVLADFSRFFTRIYEINKVLLEMSPANLFPFFLFLRNFFFRRDFNLDNDWCFVKASMQSNLITRSQLSNCSINMLFEDLSNVLSFWRDSNRFFAAKRFNLHFNR